MFIILHLYLKHTLLLVAWIDRLITRSEKSPPHGRRESDCYETTPNHSWSLLHRINLAKIGGLRGLSWQ